MKKLSKKSGLRIACTRKNTTFGAYRICPGKVNVTGRRSAAPWLRHPSGVRHQTPCRGRPAAAVREALAGVRAPAACPGFPPDASVSGFAPSPVFAKATFSRRGYFHGFRPRASDSPFRTRDNSALRAQKSEGWGWSGRSVFSG